TMRPPLLQQTDAAATKSAPRRASSDACAGVSEADCLSRRPGRSRPRHLLRREAVEELEIRDWRCRGTFLARACRELQWGRCCPHRGRFVNVGVDYAARYPSRLDTGPPCARLLRSPRSSSRMGSHQHSQSSNPGGEDMARLTINGKSMEVTVDPSTP